MSHRPENEFADLADELRDTRPEPDSEFTDRLDQAVADSFPPDWAEGLSAEGEGRSEVGGLIERLRRRIGRRRLLLPSMAGFAGLLIMATMTVGAIESGRFGSGDDDVAHQSSWQGGSVKAPKEAEAGSDRSPFTRAGIEVGPQSTGVFQINGGVSNLQSQGGSAADMMAGAGIGNIPGNQSLSIPGNQSRSVAREAQITLGTEPAGVQEVANEIVEVTDSHKGIVKNSRVADGEKGTAGADFSLLIPAAEVESAVADLSGIADLRSRSQKLTDITAPVNNTEKRIAKTNRNIKRLEDELANTYDEDSWRRIEQSIRLEKQQRGWQEKTLKRLERRINYTPVSVKVTTSFDASSDNESWGLSNAFDDAGKLLGIAAGVTLIALAVAIPIGIVILIVLALNRAWVRRARNRALSDD